MPRIGERHGPSHEDGGGDEISVEGLEGGGVTEHDADDHTNVTREWVLRPRPYVAGGGDFHTVQAFHGYRFESGETGMCYFKGKVPEDFVAVESCTVSWMGSGNTAGQDWRMRARLLHSAVGEQYDVLGETPSDQILDVTVLTEKYETDPGFTFTDLELEDDVYIQIQRKGAEGDDTYDGQIFLDRVLITYEAIE